MPFVYFSFVGSFTGERIALSDNERTRDRDYNRLTLVKKVMKITRDMKVLQKTSKEALIITLWDAGERGHVLLVNCPDGQWATAAYVTEQVGGTLNPDGVDVAVHLKPPTTVTEVTE